MPGAFQLGFRVPSLMGYPQAHPAGIQDLSGTSTTGLRGQEGSWTSHWCGCFFQPWLLRCCLMQWGYFPPCLRTLDPLQVLPPAPLSDHVTPQLCSQIGCCMHATLQTRARS